MAMVACGIYNSLVSKLVDPPTTPTRQPLSSSSAAMWGTIYGAISAIGYTATNIFLRSVTECDPVWVTCVKTIPTVVGVAPWLVVRWSRGERVFPPLPVIGMLVAAGFVGQFGGNVVFQWALGIIGLALTVPLCMGMIIVASAVLGRFMLHESVSRLMAISLAVLLVAIWVLSLGAQDTGNAIAELGSVSPWLVMAGVAAGCLSGLSYSVLGVAIRRAVTRTSTVSATIFCIASVGMISLTPLTIYRVGIEGVLQTSQADLVMMALAGVCNLIAFLALTRALQITSLVYVNALNASQVAMASVAGIVLFREPASAALSLGVALTVVGLLLIPRQKRNKPSTPALPSDRSSE
jgi:drug/metabolite transporter, DME family